MAEALVEHETLDMEEVKKVIKGEKIRVNESLEQVVVQAEKKEYEEAEYSNWTWAVVLCIFWIIVITGFEVLIYLGIWTAYLVDTYFRSMVLRTTSQGIITFRLDKSQPYKWLLVNILTSKNPMDTAPL